MLYSTMDGTPTDDTNVVNSFNLSEDSIQALADEIANILTWSNTIFFNVQIEEELSQYDVIISNVYYNQGYHQRGIKPGDVIIGVIGLGCYGFRCLPKNETHPSYYYEKLGVGSKKLSELFNLVRDRLGGGLE